MKLHVVSICTTIQYVTNLSVLCNTPANKIKMIAKKLFASVSFNNNDHYIWNFDGHHRIYWEAQATHWSSDGYPCSLRTCLDSWVGEKWKMSKWEWEMWKCNRKLRFVKINFRCLIVTWKCKWKSILFFRCLASNVKVEVKKLDHKVDQKIILN